MTGKQYENLAYSMACGMLIGAIISLAILGIEVMYTIHRGVIWNLKN